MGNVTSNLRRRESRVCLIACCLWLSACGNKSDAGSSAHADAGQTAGGADGSAGSVGSAGANVSAGGGGAGASSTAGGGSAGALSAAAGAAGAGGSGATPLSVTLTPHAITVMGGLVFNIADDYFDDTFSPASPLANFGFQTPIVPLTHADGSMDIAWLDYTGGKGQPFALPTIGMINITHVDAALSVGTTVATGIKSYRLLGFTMDAAGSFYIAYNADHPFKDATNGGANNVSGNELHVAKSTSSDFGGKAWDTLLFGDKDNTKDLSKGNAGAAGSGVLGFDAMNQKIVVYVAHQMAWGDNGTRHQAGFFSYLDPATGVAMVPGGAMPVEEFGTEWFYSHNFDQRLLIDGGTSYVLAHGDAYARQLGLGAFTLKTFAKNTSLFDKPYFPIDGTEGDNNTNAETGQFIKLSDGRFAIIHTSSQGRAARDVHIVLADSTTGVSGADAWLTTNVANTQATMPKLEALGGQLFVSYGLWDSAARSNKQITWYWQSVDLTLKPTSAATAMPDVEFVTSSPMIRFAGGPNAGSIGWVSGNASHTLSVNVVSAK
jgi:hypothetical protein